MDTRGTRRHYFLARNSVSVRPPLPNTALAGPDYTTLIPILSPPTSLHSPATLTLTYHRRTRPTAQAARSRNALTVRLTGGNYFLHITPSTSSWGEIYTNHPPLSTAPAVGKVWVLQNVDFEVCCDVALQCNPNTTVLSMMTKKRL